MDDRKYFRICNTVNIIALVISVALAVISWFVLPDQVVSTLGDKGDAETLSKLEAIAIPFLITLVGEVIYFSKKDFRAIIVTVIGIFAYFLNFFCNL